MHLYVNTMHRKNTRYLWYPVCSIHCPWKYAGLFCKVLIKPIISKKKQTNKKTVLYYPSPERSTSICSKNVWCVEYEEIGGTESQHVFEALRMYYAVQGRQITDQKWKKCLPTLEEISSAGMFLLTHRITGAKTQSALLP